jgi:hypothetical protein
MLGELIDPTENRDIVCVRDKRAGFIAVHAVGSRIDAVLRQ